MPQYWPVALDKQIDRFNLEKDLKTKNEIYTNYIHKPLCKLAENIINRYIIHDFSDYEKLHAECVAFCFLNMHKYNSKKAKSFSYFGMAIKHKAVKIQQYEQRFKYLPGFSEENIIVNNLTDACNQDDFNEKIEQDDRDYNIIKAINNIKIQRSDFPNYCSTYKQKKKIFNYFKKQLQKLIKSKESIYVPSKSLMGQGGLQKILYKTIRNAYVKDNKKQLKNSEQVWVWNIIKQKMAEQLLNSAPTKNMKKFI